MTYVPITKNRRPDRVEPVPDISGPAYRTKAPIEDKDRIQRIVNKFLDADITLSAEELLTSSKELQEALKRLITKKRVPPDKPKVPPDKPERVALVEEMTEEEMIYLENLWRDYPTGMPIDVNNLPPATFMITSAAGGEIPPGSVVLDDPVVQYFDSLAPGEKPREIYVARESQGLRAVYPLINKTGEIETILDGGSQIVSMGKATALSLQLQWDPDIHIHMQSANKQVEKSLGLSRNVPFVFGDIALYLQVHIINDPAYKVLLGRPFDALTESCIQNTRDGGQMITIKDPNTGHRSTIPTYERGRPPEILKREKTTEVFQHSRI